MLAVSERRVEDKDGSTSFLPRGVDNSFLASSSQPAPLFDRPKIHYLVGCAMRDHEEFRLHKNRENLWLYLKSTNPDCKMSFESVVRSQRKHWEAGRYLPSDPEELLQFHILRNTLANEIKVWVKQ